MDGKAEGRWLRTSPCDNERVIVLNTYVLRAYGGKSSERIPPGPRSRVETIQSNWVSSAHCPTWPTCFPEDGKHCALLLVVSDTSRKQRAILQQREEGERRRWRSPSCKLGKPERWRPSLWPVEVWRQADYRGRQPLGWECYYLRRNARILFCLLGVWAADTCRQRRWTRQGALEEARARRFGGV